MLESLTMQSSSRAPGYTLKRQPLPVKTGQRKYGILYNTSPTFTHCQKKNVQRFRFGACSPNLKSKFPPFFQQISSISKAPPLSLPRGGRWEHKNDPQKKGALCSSRIYRKMQLYRVKEVQNWVACKVHLQMVYIPKGAMGLEYLPIEIN